jgi:hypothetical protein
LPRGGAYAGNGSAEPGIAAGVAPDGGNSLLSLIPAKPLFYHKDFREILQMAYKSLEKAMRKHVPGKMENRLVQLAAKLDSFDDVMILLNPDLSVEDVALVVNGNDEQEVRISFSELEALLDCLDPLQLSACNDALRGVALHRQFSLALASNGAIMPQLITNKSGSKMIRICACSLKR